MDRLLMPMIVIVVVVIAAATVGVVDCNTIFVCAGSFARHNLMYTKTVQGIFIARQLCEGCASFMQGYECSQILCISTMKATAWSRS